MIELSGTLLSCCYSDQEWEGIEMRLARFGGPIEFAQRRRQMKLALVALEMGYTPSEIGEMIGISQAEAGQVIELGKRLYLLDEVFEAEVGDAVREFAYA